MKLYEFIPEKNTKKLTSVTGILLFGAAAIMLLTIVLQQLPFKWVFQLISIGMLAAGIFITTRFIMKAYIYNIEKVAGSEDGNLADVDLTVTEIQGRHVITVCRLSLSGIEDAIRVSDKASFEKIRQKIKKDGRKTYNYCANIAETEHIWVLASEGGEPLAIKLSYDKKLLELLKNQ